jgi:hypothetical protein
MKKGWLIAGVVVGSTAGTIVVACSSDNSTGTTTGTTTHETTSNTTTSGTGGTTTTSSTGNTTTSSCQSDPHLHGADAGSIYCGFDDAGNNFSCPTGMQCCIGGSIGGGNFAPDECAPWGTACMNPANKGLAVPCEQPADCAANDGGASSVCCLMGTTPALVPGCDSNDYKASGGTGTQCVSGTTCGAGNAQLCLNQSDCPSGMTCTAFRWKIIQMGFCM